MNHKDIQDIIEEYERRILSADNKQNVQLTNEWSKKIPVDAGIYAFFDQEKMVYVGEFGSLRGRLNDLRRTVNHTLRRSIGEERFSDVEGYKKATSKRKFPDHIEKMVETYLCSLRVSVLPVAFGRTEIEEYLISKYKPTFNNKSKRGQ